MTLKEIQEHYHRVDTIRERHRKEVNAVIGKAIVKWVGITTILFVLGLLLVMFLDSM